MFKASCLWSSLIEQELSWIVSEPLFLLLKLSCYREKQAFISNILVRDWMGKEELLSRSMSLPPRRVSDNIYRMCLWSHISHTALHFVRCCSLCLKMDFQSCSIHLPLLPLTDGSSHSLCSGRDAYAKQKTFCLPLSCMCTTSGSHSWAWELQPCDVMGYFCMILSFWKLKSLRPC